MNTFHNKRLGLTLVLIITAMLAVWQVLIVHGGQKTYEIQPQISLPEYRTDAARAIDAYERLTQQYMALQEQNLATINARLQHLTEKIQTLDHKITQVSSQLAQLQKAFDLDRPTHSPTRGQPHPSDTDTVPTAPKQPALTPATQ